MGFIDFLPLVVVFAHFAHSEGQQSYFKRHNSLVGKARSPPHGDQRPCLGPPHPQNSAQLNKKKSGTILGYVDLNLMIPKVVKTTTIS